MWPRSSLNEAFLRAVGLRGLASRLGLVPIDWGEAQGAIFGWVSDSDRVIAAIS